MGWLFSIAIIFAAFINKPDTIVMASMIIASGLFAIAGSISIRNMTGGGR